MYGCVCCLPIRGRYPAELARGRADKYTAYTQQQPSGTKQ
jgi:hypothetical protein